MARFIAWSGHSPPVSDNVDKLWENIIDAYIYLCGLPFILNYAGEAIYKQPLLKAYFEVWPTAKDYFTLREAQRWRQVDNQDWSAYRDYILSKTGYSKSLYDLFNPRETLLNVERYKCARLLEIQDDQKLADEDVCTLPSTMLKETAEPSLFFYLQKEAVCLASVFIGLDVSIILSNILLLGIYRKAIKIAYDRDHVPAWLKFQSTRINTTQGFYAKHYFDDYGKIIANIPAPVGVPNIATLDTYKLKLTLDLYKPPWFCLFKEEWSAVPIPPPVFELYYLEPWTEYVPPPPVFELKYLEPWTIGITLPPDMELKYLEPWTIGITLPPDMELYFLEPWTYYVPPPPPNELKYKEIWSS